MKTKTLEGIRHAAEETIQFRDEKEDLENEECATCNEFVGHVASHLEWTKGDSCHMCHQKWSLVATPDRVLELVEGYMALREALNKLYGVQSKYTPGRKQSWTEAMDLSFVALRDTKS